jgi:hypothetical protein
MILNRESTRKDEKMLSKVWVILYFDKTILVLTLLRPSSSVRVVSESLGPICGSTEYFLCFSGPPLATATRSEYLSSHPRAFCSAPDLFTGPHLRTSFRDPHLTGPPFRTARVLLFFSSDLRFGASNPTPSASAPSQCSSGPPVSAFS